MAEGSVVALTWDWREQPDLDALDKAVANFTNLGVRILEVDTGSDQYAVLVTTRDIAPEDLYAEYLAAVGADEEADHG